uniref:Uncharacterized protein n=1 Tax=Pongo abelii TaxID=9601 RepID=A0A8I5U657_PONAB
MFQWGGYLSKTVETGQGGQARWLTPVIPALWEARRADHPRSGVCDQPGQHGEIPSLLKIQKLAGHGGGWLRQENRLNPGGTGFNRARLHHCTPAWARKQASSSRGKKKKKKK